MSNIVKKQRRSEEKWASIVRSYHQSTLSKTAFCKAHKLSRSNFYMWDRYFAEAKEDQARIAASAFVPVSLVDAEATTAKSHGIAPVDRIKSALQLENSQGLRLSFANGCSYGELAKVMELLQHVA